MSVQAEKAVLGCMMLDEECVRIGADALDPEMFQTETGRRIFTTVMDRYWDGKPIDGVTMATCLPDDAKLLIELAEQTPTLRHFSEYVRIIQDDWRRISIQKAASIIMVDATIRPVEESIEALRKILQEQEQIDRAQKDTGISFTEAAHQLMEFLKAKETDTSIKTGFSYLDRATGGFLRKSVTALCARSGCGKTDYATNLALRMVKRGYRVQYFSMEMPAVQLMQRVTANIAKIDGTRIRVCFKTIKVTKREYKQGK